ncbi:MAG: malonyl-CoA decarboxylase [Rhodobacterales bacterium]|jgi:malonyl-CoA decarboxylase|nr:malonyl-CoA decarboxylase [Rhodobacterales bacterium]MDA9308591.1 malonyl-CoA decarboxylase [Amylibacter sp.]
MSKFVNILSAVFEKPQNWIWTKEKNEQSVYDLIDDLLGASGEVKGVTLAREILNYYFSFSSEEKLSFFNYLCVELDIIPDDIRKKLDIYEANKTKINYSAYMSAAEPKRQELIRKLNQVPAATPKLVEMRCDLLKLVKKYPKLAAVDLDFQHLFASWFNRGFLVLQKVSWQSPANILEKIIQYEAVHEIKSWKDLQGRLEPENRRCFAFFHPSMPNEPLIFVEVALTHGIPNSIQDLLNNEQTVDENIAFDTAVFYSISNCQSGLAGISFGNFLIKQVVEDLTSEFGNLKTFVTLSPIPLFQSWLKNEGAKIKMKENNNLSKLVAFYLLNGKRDDGLPFDPVARFHLGNGAQVHAVHENADISEKGINQSQGMMVNYLYDPSMIGINHEKFVSENIIPASNEIISLSKSVIKVE